MVYQIIQGTILMILVPVAVGLLVAKTTGACECEFFTLASFAYVMGHVVMWAVFQLVAVPLILLKSTLSVVMILWIVGLLAVSIVLLWLVCSGRTGRVQAVSSEEKKHDESKPVLIFSIVLAVILVGFQCYVYVRYMHLDEDDARFVVNAVDAYDSGTMFLTHPATGNYEGTWIGEMVKDVSSPWSIYLAMLAKFAHIHPTILAHSVYPAFLLLAGYMAYYLMGTVFFRGDRTKSFLLVAITAAANMTFGQSLWNQSYFSLVRIWQGKATVAGVMIPFLAYLLYRLYQNPKAVSGYLLLIPAAMAMCLMSGMGIFFSGIMIGTYGIWFALVTKNPKRLLLVLLACLPTIVYGLSYTLVR